jgi:hypothetical protein
MPSSRGGWGALSAVDDFEIKLTAEQEDAITAWSSDVWAFCTGAWPLATRTGQKGTREPKPIIWTQDKRRAEVRPFPAYPYLRDAVLHPIFHAPLDGGEPHRFTIRKPRQTFVSNGILTGCLWDVLFHPATEWLVAKNKAPEAIGFLKKRVRFMYNRLPRWFREWCPVRPKPAAAFHVEKTESYITAVASTFGVSGEAVGETAKVLFDECIRIRHFRAAWLAADAQSPVMVAVSAPPERGQPLDAESLAFFRELAEDRDEGSLTRSILGRSDWREMQDQWVDDDDDAAASALESVL